ncbi:uncharacterized protein LOC123878026 isoform X1 [Maniola jurtina]|uniref:uncharacterized protein LOC123878026 isoform X1 n=1 Tax=Maniola jurtina TaxID=191418 RepID=UPI001E687257|nr:uncharacterized protein LOC123878026 isoform X1 [Maniola jurtina]
MKRTTYIIIFCIIFHFGLSRQDSESVGDSIIEEENKMLNNQESKDIEDDEDFNEKLGYQSDEMEKAREAGDAADLFGTNQHYNIPVNYQDFGRRFVLTYPYVEKSILNDAAETELDNIVKKYLESKITSQELIPVKAPPEFVLQVAKQSALLEASKPINPPDEKIQKDILRTGEYWDGVWKEDVDVEKMLRSVNKRNKLDYIRVKIPFGSRLHTLISKLNSRSPRFLYVINKNER